MPLPLPDIVSIRDFMVFEQHVRTARARRGAEVPAEWYEAPTFYYSNPRTLFGHGSDVPRPAYTQKLDFELEIACVLDSGGVDLTVEQAEACIAGLCIFNDWSARDVQRQEMAVGLGPSKAKDFAQSLGPHLVPLAELAERRVGPGKYDLAMQARINGVQVSAGNARDMRWGFAELVAHASQTVPLVAGEVFGSGTVGTGCILELGTEVHRWLEPGDEVELEIELLGVLRNRVV